MHACRWTPEDPAIGVRMWYRITLGTLRSRWGHRSLEASLALKADNHLSFMIANWLSGKKLQSCITLVDRCAHLSTTYVHHKYSHSENQRLTSEHVHQSPETHTVNLDKSEHLESPVPFDRIRQLRHLQRLTGIKVSAMLPILWPEQSRIQIW